eukprot:TRINITY_DN4159_c0_g1_i1.p1 TRINITY_DN4159_c0_g1~~TRINITY_DN4159_c0_g1_i1.p1  ORF type:complete len:1135 (-),score=208.60 TRINITY_DN4159_c0_g1_i1:144-3341(-)
MAVIHEDYLLEVMTITELYLERVALRMDVIAAQTSCPLDIMEQVASLCYIAPFLSTIDELLKLRDAFSKKYGQGFMAECMECKCISPKVLDRLSRAPPTDALVDFYLGTIAMKFEIEWESSGLTDVDDELFDPLIIDEEINEEKFIVEQEKRLLEENHSDSDHEFSKLEFPSMDKSDNNPLMTEGVLRPDSKGNYWVLESSNTANPIFIPGNSLANAKAGDRVSVLLDVRRDSKRSGKIVTVLPKKAKHSHSGDHHLQTKLEGLKQSLNSSSNSSSHSSPARGRGPPVVTQMGGDANYTGEHKLVGKLKIDLNNNAWISHRAPSGQDLLVYVPANQTNGARDGDDVSFVFHERSDGKLSGTVVSVLNQFGAPTNYGYDQNYAAPIGALSPPSHVSPSTHHRQPHAHVQPQGHVHDYSHAHTHARAHTHVHSDLAPQASPESARISGISGNREGDIMMDINGNHWLQPRNGAAWNTRPGTQEFIFIAPEDLNGSQNGDSVVASVSSEPFPGTTCFGARVIEILHTENQYKIVQLVGILKLEDSEDASPRDGFLFNRETSEVVFIPNAWLNGASDEDLVLVDARELPPNHPCASRAQWEGHVVKVIENNKMTFDAELHTIHETEKESAVGWVNHPTNESQRIVVPVDSWNGAKAGDHVTIVTASIHGHVVGKVTRIVSRGEEKKEGSGETEDTARSLSLVTSELGTKLETPIIIELGSCVSRIGFLEDEMEKFISLPSIVGHTIFSSVNVPPMASDTVYVGDDCLTRTGILHISNPIQDGLITNWTDLSHLLHHLLVTKLKCTPSLHPVLLLLSNRTGDFPAEDQERIFHILFHEFKVPAAGIYPKWALYHHVVPRDSFLVVSLKEHEVIVLPVSNKKTLFNALRSTGAIGGSQITCQLMKLMTLEGLGTFETFSEKQAVKSIKEKYAYLPLEAAQEKKTVSYAFSDGREIEIPSLILEQCGEVLFNPTLIGSSNALSLPNLIKQSLEATDPELHSSLLGNILLCGGTANLRGLSERLLQELSLIFPQSTPQILDKSIVHPSEVIFRGALALLTADEPAQWRTRPTH